jgi:hypothetical protein
MGRRGVRTDRKRALRAAVILRDGGRCFYCRTRFDDIAEATLDHLVPLSQGGPWAMANLVLACQPCNEAKGDLPPHEFLRPAGFLPGLRPGGVEWARRAATGSARVGRTAALVPAALLVLALVELTGTHEGH